MPKKEMSKDQRARLKAIAEGRCSRCKARPIDYERSIAKCARCLDRRLIEAAAKRAGVKPEYPQERKPKAKAAPKQKATVQA